MTDPKLEATPEMVRVLYRLGYSQRQIAAATGWSLDQVQQAISQDEAKRGES